MFLVSGVLEYEKGFSYVNSVFGKSGISEGVALFSVLLKSLSITDVCFSFSGIEIGFSLGGIEAIEL